MKLLALILLFPARLACTILWLTVWLISAGIGDSVGSPWKNMGRFLLFGLPKK